MHEETIELAQQVVKLGVEHGVSVGAAESCTGGLVCGAITSIPGSSAVLMGGVVSYDPSVKEKVLGVPRDIIDEPTLGVVSADCASMMATGVRRVLGCDVSVSVTGIAGPGGEEPGKPVGTVWFGVADSSGVHEVLRRFEGSRDEVREQATCCALSLLCEAIVKQ